MKIYAGRIDYGNVKLEMPDLLNDPPAGKVENNPKRFWDTPAAEVTFSDEGLASSKALRAYSKEHGLRGQVDWQAQMEDRYKRLHTQWFESGSICRMEMNEILGEIKKEYDLPSPSEGFELNLTLRAKAYQVVYDRIEAEFQNPDREKTYLWDNVNQDLVEETKEDRLNGLEQAYKQQTEEVAVIYKYHAGRQESNGGKTEDPDTVYEKIKDAYAQAVEKENLEKLRQKVSAFEEYKLTLDVGEDWIKKFDQCMNDKKG